MRASSRKRAFTLVELVITLTITLIMVAVAGSLLSGLVSMHQLTAEQSATKRRTQDLFNMIGPAMRNAGLGIPTPKSAAERSHYFDNAGAMQWSNAYLASWNGPIDVIGKASRGAHESDGDILRIMYSLPTGIKFTGGSSPDPSETSSLRPSAGAPMTLGFISEQLDAFVRTTDPSSPFGVRVDTSPAPHDSRSLVTFPGAHTYPLFVASATRSSGSDDGKGVMVLRGTSPYTGAADDALTEVLPRGIIYPYAELCLFRASVAYVADGTFYMLDIESAEDPFKDGALPDPDTMKGFRLDGVKAVRFFPSSDGREVTAWVLFEGDIDDASRVERSQPIASLKDRTIDVEGVATKLWESVAFDDGRYYEDTFMTWRVRNVGIR